MRWIGGSFVWMGMMSAPAWAETPPDAETKISASMTSDKDGATLHRVDFYVKRAANPQHDELKENVSTVCVAPCNATLDLNPGVAYFVDGPGFPASKRFKANKQMTEIRVQAGNTNLQRFVGGSLMTAGVAIPLGLIFFGVGESQNNKSQLGEGSPFFAVGIATFFTGVVLMGVAWLVEPFSNTLVNHVGRRGARNAVPTLTLNGLVF